FLLALVLVVSLTLYALLGGADYGGGLWDLFASGPTADRQRATIAHAIGPVWEANHVWLIVAIVILFSGFPRAFSALSTFLHVPLVLVLLGIVLRGSAFVFRAYGPAETRHVRLWGRMFAIASIATPLFLGVIIGAISDGQLPPDANGTFVEVFIRPWLTPFSMSVGVFAAVLFGYLAAVYLTLEAHDLEERAAFRARALVSGVLVGVMAATVLALAGPDLRRGLVTSAWAGPLHVATGMSAVAAFGLLWWEHYRPARLAAAFQVTLILWGWALAQYPFALRPHMTLAQATAPESVRVMLLQVIGGGAVVLLPSLLLLFRVFGPRGGGGRAAG
ncbi:MAG: cytochrome d ubiquinol oxidase subunit II, partial [Vicinamibacterales bacterium]